jgi:hypothetical protein
VYLQKIAMTTLDVITWHIILWVGKVLLSRILLLWDWDSRTWKDHVHKCVPCHLSHVDVPFLVVVPTIFRCMLCGQANEDATMLIYDQCSQDWHMGSTLSLQFTKYWLANGFVLNIPNKSKTLFLWLDGKKCLNLFSNGTFNWPRIWGNTTRQLTKETFNYT